MPEPDRTQILLQLVAARSALSVAISMLDEQPHIEMPAGYETDKETACSHPASRRVSTFGRHGYCKDCGAKW